MIVIIDYGMGNVGSIYNMLRYNGTKSIVSSKTNDVEMADISLKDSIYPVKSCFLFLASCVAVAAVCKWWLGLPVIIQFFVVGVLSALYFIPLLRRISVFQEQILRVAAILRLVRAPK